MTRAEIEYTLRKSGWYPVHTIVWRPWNERAYPNRRVKLGRSFLLFNTNEWPRIAYTEITPYLWEQMTGLKFHRMKKESM